MSTNITIVQGDITQQTTEAIVNAANSSLLGGGGVDGDIHRAAGPDLVHECRLLHGCKTGKAKITKGYRLPAKYIIHTVGPVWNGGNKNEEELLESCYDASLKLAMSKGIRSIAFPSISTGIYNFPKEKAADYALNAILEFVYFFPEAFDEIVLVCFDKETYDLYNKLNSNE